MFEKITIKGAGYTFVWWHWGIWWVVWYKLGNLEPAVTSWNQWHTHTV